MTRKHDHNESFFQVLEEPEHHMSESLQKSLYEEQNFITNEELSVRVNEHEFYPLLITNYRIIVLTPQIKSYPYGYIHSLTCDEKHLKIKLKNSLVILFQTSDSEIIYNYISMVGIVEPFCLKVQNSVEKSHIYDSYAEIQRMRVDKQSYVVYKNNGMFLGYPFFLVLVKNVSENILEEVKKCRYGGCIPVLSFFHDRYSVGLWRASKLKPKLHKEVAKFDEAYLVKISPDLEVFSINQGSKNAIDFFDPLPTMRDNFQKLINKYAQLSKDRYSDVSGVDFWKLLGRWYLQIDKLISAAYHIMRKLTDQIHVLIEETYGHDRVSQIIALCSVICDPYYRTFQGFSVLIEKEFVGFGHPFHDRCGYSGRNEETAPVFIQFLECLHQLLVTHPSCFEYSSSYLARIGYELYTTRFKNFLPKNNPKTAKKLKQCPNCIWQLPMQPQFYNYNFRHISRELWQLRRKPNMKQYQTFTPYYNAITQMNIEKPPMNGKQIHYTLSTHFKHKIVE